jgi:pimeloyl-ACP methyl ester carboxylesterase
MGWSEAMTPRRDYSLQVQGLTLHVTEWGDKNSRPVIMLHGIRGYAETFTTVAEELQPAYRVIAFDQRGRGESDWDPAHNYYADAYVADLEGVCAALGIERFDLLGHSMGGINALVYAAANPDRVDRMVIEDAGPGAFENSKGAQRIQRELETTPVAFPDWDSAAAYMRELRPTITEAAREERLRSMLKPRTDGGFTWRHDHEGIASTRLRPDPQRVPDLVSAVRAVRCPTLVLRGGRSDYLQPEMAEDMVRLNPLIQWREIPDAGHYVHDDQPEAFCREVREFLCNPTR